MSAPHRRGFELQSFVATVFEQAHFTVRRDAQIARPRQTDVLATNGRETYLIETKWTKRTSGVGHVDELRARLDETTPSVIGVLVTIAGVSQKAEDRIIHHRKRPILVITGDELEQLAAWPQGLARTLARKHRELVINAKVVVDTESAWSPRAVRSTQLPTSALSIVFPDGRRSHVISCNGGFDDGIFVSDLPDVDWIHASGSAVALDLSIEIEDQGGLLQVLAELVALGWSTDARWTIQQARTSWHGFGTRSCVTELQRWKERYTEIDRVHHTEQLRYQDSFEGGLYTIAADVSARDSRRVDYCNISFQLLGVPVDAQPLRHICEAFGVEHHAYFRPMRERAVTSHRFWGDAPKALTVIGFLVPDPDPEVDLPGEEWVRGLVVENPYSSALSKAGSDPTPPEWWPRGVVESEYLISDLRSWHPLGEQRDAYRLAMCEWTWTTDSIVFRAVADWD